MRLGPVLAVAAVEVGALVGAGFASGREVLEYFGPPLGGGWAGIVAFAALLALLGGVVLDAARRLGSRSYRDLTLALAGPGLSRAADPVVALGLFLGLATTLAGAGALSAQARLAPEGVGLAAAAVVTAALARSGVAGLVAVNALVVPALVAVVALVAGLPQPPAGAGWPQAVRALAGGGGERAVLYVLYNGLLAIVLFASLGSRIGRREEGWAAAAVGAGLLGLMALAILQTLERHPASQSAAMPLLHVARSSGGALGAAFTWILAGELLTTAVGNAYGLAARLTAAGVAPAAAAAAPVAGAAALASAGFVPLVRYGYRAVAFAGAGYLLLLAVGAVLRGGRGGGHVW